MNLESGPAKADRNWHIIRAVIFVVAAMYFFYDGMIGYPRANRASAEQKLADRELFDGKITYDQLQRKETPDRRIVDDLRKADRTSHEEVRRALGEPQRVRDDGAGRTTEFFAGRWGYAAVPVDRGKVDPGSLVWTAWGKTRDDIRLQFVCAAIAAIPGLYFLWKLYKAMTLHVTIDDEGMVYGGRRIAFANMVSLRDYSLKGWIDLYHKVGESEKKLRLDNEKVAKFDELVAAICQAKGFTNEVKAHAARKAREEVQEEEPAKNPPDDDGHAGG